MLEGEAITYLEKAINATPGNDLRLADVLDEAALDCGLIYLIKIKRELFGVTYTVLGKGLYGTILNVVLLGGKQMHRWKLDYRAFIIDLMKLFNCQQVCFIGRDGWQKIFPEAKPVGTIFIAGIPN